MLTLLIICEINFCVSKKMQPMDQPGGDRQDRRLKLTGAARVSRKEGGNAMACEERLCRPCPARPETADA
jgi:hypothetical protein